MEDELEYSFENPYLFLFQGIIATSFTLLILFIITHTWQLSTLTLMIILTIVLIGINHMIGVGLTKPSNQLSYLIGQIIVWGISYYFTKEPTIIAPILVAFTLTLLIGRILENRWKKEINKKIQENKSSMQDGTIV